MSTPRRQDDDATLALIDQAQKGDEKAFVELYVQYKNLINKLCSLYRSDAVAVDDLYSEASIAFWKAVENYLPGSGGVTFGQYAQVCIRNRLLDCLHKWQKVNNTVSLDTDEVAKIHADAESDPAHYVLEQEQYLEFYKRMEQVLSEGEKEIWMLFITGMTASEIAEKLGRNKKSVENAIFRARVKLREAILHPDNA